MSLRQAVQELQIGGTSQARSGSCTTMADGCGSSSTSAWSPSWPRPSSTASACGADVLATIPHRKSATRPPTVCTTSNNRSDAASRAHLDHEGIRYFEIGINVLNVVIVFQRLYQP